MVCGRRVIRVSYCLGLTSTVARLLLTRRLQQPSCGPSWANLCLRQLGLKKRCEYVSSRGLVYRDALRLHLLLTSSPRSLAFGTRCAFAIGGGCHCCFR